MVNYKELLFKFLEDENNRKYCVPILQRILMPNKRKGKFIVTIDKNKKRLELKPEELEGKIEGICEFVVEKTLIEGYNALAVPFMISRDQAPNFSLFEEKPKEDELWWWIYHLLTGIHFGSIVINLVNVSEEIRNEFREFLVSKKFVVIGGKSGLNTKEILSQVKVPAGIPLGEQEFILGFLFLTYFAIFWASRKGKESVEEFKKNLETTITSDASLFVFVLPREKKRVYVFPRLNRLLINWYEDLFSLKEEEPPIPKISMFAFSFYIRDENYRDITCALLNKFFYYFLSGHINGEILSKLVDIKTVYELKGGIKGRIRSRFHGIPKKAAEFFFSKL
jgi:hypothetical protein